MADHEQTSKAEKYLLAALKAANHSLDTTSRLKAGVIIAEAIDSGRGAKMAAAIAAAAFNLNPHWDGGKLVIAP